MRLNASSRGAATRCVGGARRSAGGSGAELLAKAKAESDETARRSREGIEADRERASEQVRDLIAVLSLELAQKGVAGRGGPCPPPPRGPPGPASGGSSRICSAGGCCRSR